MRAETRESSFLVSHRRQVRLVQRTFQDVRCPVGDVRELVHSAEVLLASWKVFLMCSGSGMGAPDLAQF